MSLALKLALVMTGLVAAGVIGLLVVVHGTLVAGAEELTRTKLSRVARDLASRAEQAAQPRIDRTRLAARSAPVLRALRPGADSAAIEAARDTLDKLKLAARDSSAIELWDASGHPIARVGDPIPDALRDEPVPTDMGTSAVWNGSLRRVGNAVHLWAIVPVDSAGRRLGYIARFQWVRGSKTLSDQLRTLTGEDVALIIRNTDGSVWTTAAGEQVTPPDRRDSTSEGVSYWRGRERSVALEAQVRDTPWMIAIEVPERVLLAAPRATTRRLALFGAILVVLGALIAWRLGRRITRPLAALTEAAHEVGRGTYEHPVAGGGGNEIETLARTFDGMARRVTTAQAELERRAADAQEYAAELTRANARLHDAILDAEAASRAKSDFLAVMSHELRTPLNAIGGYTELISMGIYGDVTDSQQDALARVARSQRHLLSLIDDVLGFARLESGQTHFDIGDVAIAETLTGVEAIVLPQAQARRVTLELAHCPPSLLVRADGDKLRQVLLNLVTNAIKFTPEGGRIQVSCEMGEREVQLRVSDTGPGIPADRLDAIFEPFVQGDRALNRPSEGVGLGLAISRDLARGMGATLEVESTVGAGAVFTLTLPRAGTAAHVGATAASDDSKAHGTAPAR